MIPGCQRASIDQKRHSCTRVRELIPDQLHRDPLLNWWLAVPARTPNIDIASTCEVLGRDGLLLIEAKAHDWELRQEEKGKPLDVDCSDNSRKNHEQIGSAIKAANASLSKYTNVSWSLSRDCRYQMSNRFAWAWKLCELGIPVILAYVGFMGCEEMRDGEAQNPMDNGQHWQELVFDHSRPLFPDEIWNREWQVNGQSFVPLIVATNQLLDTIE